MTGVARGRLAWIDLIRGFAVLLVVVYHSIIALKISAAHVPHWVNDANNTAAPYRMPILMFLSGLLLPRSLGKPRRQYVTGKLCNIAWPYVVWTTITVAILYAGSSLAGNGNFSPGRLFAFVIDPTTFTWYLAYLLLFYGVALVLPGTVRGLMIPLLLIACGVVHSSEGWSRLTYLFAFFLLGDLAARHRPRWDRLQDNRFVTGVCGILAVASVVLAAKGFIIRYEAWGAVGVAATIVVLIPLATKVSGSRQGQLLAGIGKDSLIYYVTHWPVVLVGVHVANALHLRQWWLILGLLLAVGLGVPWLVVRLRRRWSLVSWLYAWSTPKPATSALSDSAHRPYAGPSPRSDLPAPRP